MIERPTVLVLGAGASMPYGFPSGEGLKFRVLSLLAGKTSAFDEMVKLGWDQREVERFVQALRHAGRPSVDAFLEHRPEFINVGKAAIAQALLPDEKTGILFTQGDGKWYEYLYQRMNSSFETFGENQLAVVTFNYDRSFEHYLHTALMNSYGKSDEECAEKLSTIRIIHVHGQLGYLPWQPQVGKEALSYDKRDDRRSEWWVSAIRYAAPLIKVVHQPDVESDPEFQKAKEVLQNAQRIWFLGFGYDETNLRRLDLYGPKKVEIQIYGTTYGKTPKEVNRFADNVTKRRDRLADPSHDILAFLRNDVDIN